MDVGEPKTAGTLLRKIRSRKNLTVEVVAGRAGISAGFLSQVEQGTAVLGRLAHWRGVADALGVPLSELVRLDVPAPGNGHTDSGTEAIRNALSATLASPQAQLLAIKGSDPVAPLAEAAEIADRFGEVGAADPYGFGFGPGGPVDDAIRAHLKAEAFLPVKLYRNLRTREVLRNLLTRAPDNEQLQQLAKRASLDQR